jgi:hypothetical protein
VLLTERVKVVPNGYRYLLSFPGPVEELDFYTLCEVLRFVGAAVGFIQAEVYVEDRLAANFYYRLYRYGGKLGYVGPSRRNEGGRWIVFGKFYELTPSGGRHRLVSGSLSCDLPF